MLNLINGTLSSIGDIGDWDDMIKEENGLTDVPDGPLRKMIH